MKRPLLLPIILFLLGVIFADKISLFYGLNINIILPVLVVSFVLLIAGIRFDRIFKVLLLLFFFALGIFRFTSFSGEWEHDVRQYASGENKEVLIKGVVCSEPVRKTGGHFNKLSFNVTPDKLIYSEQERPVTGKVLVDLYGRPDDIRIGDIVAVSGELSIPGGKTNPAGFDYKNYLKYQGIASRLVSSSHDLSGVIGRTKDPVFLFRRTLSRIKQRALGIIGDYLPGESRDLMDSILLGRRQGLDTGTKDLFAKTGTMHIIAVSGLHVGIIGASILAVLLAVRIPKKMAYVLTILSIFSFALMSGARPSAMRAAIMLSFLLLSQLLNRRVDLISSLFLSAFIIVFASPGQLFTPGFILSYSAVLSIIFLTPVLKPFIARRRGLRPRNKALRPLTTSISVSLAVWLGTLPIVTSYFNIISPSVVIANLIAIPVLFLLIIAGGILVALGSFSFLSIIAGYLALAINWIINSYFAALKAIAALPFAYLKVSSPYPVVVVLYYVLIVLLVISYKRKSNDIKQYRALVLVFFLSAGNLFVWNQFVKGMPPERAEVTFFDTGKSDAAVMEFPSGEVVIIDGGSGGFEEGKTDHGRNVIAPYLVERGIGKIDCVIMSHPHEDHIGGLFYLTQNFDVGTLITADQPYKNSWYYKNYLDLAKKKGIKHIKTARGDHINGIYNIQLAVFNPTEIPYGDLNNDSLVFGVNTVGGAPGPEILFTGDIGRDAIIDILRFGSQLKSDIIKAPHHGQWGKDDLVLRSFLETTSDNNTTYIVTNKDPEKVSKAYLNNNELFITGRDGSVKFTLPSELLEKQGG